MLHKMRVCKNEKIRVTGLFTKSWYKGIFKNHLAGKFFWNRNLKKKLSFNFFSPPGWNFENPNVPTFW